LEIDFLPHEIESHGKSRRVYFDTQERRWVDGKYMGLSVDENVAIDADFREKYGLNGEVRLFVLDGHERS